MVSFLPGTPVLLNDAKQKTARKWFQNEACRYGRFYLGGPTQRKQYSLQGSEGSPSPASIDYTPHYTPTWPN